VLITSVDPKRVQEIENILNREPGLTSALVPGVPIPAWINDEDLPPEFRPK